MTITADRRRRIEFFADHGGYCTPPGRMVVAKSLADAEERREALEADGRLTVTWEYEEVADVSWADEETLRKLEDGTYEVLACLVTLDLGDEAKTAGLGNIVVAGSDRDYIRVVEAELVSELLAELEV